MSCRAVRCRAQDPERLHEATASPRGGEIRCSTWLDPPPQPVGHPYWYRFRYHSAVAVNLRLNPDLALELKRVADQLGVSQQEAIRTAIERYIRDHDLRDYPVEIRHLITPARSPYREVPLEELVALREGSPTSAEMIREQRGGP